MKNARDFKPVRPVIKKIDDSLSFVEGEKPRPKVIFTIMTTMMMTITMVTTMVTMMMSMMSRTMMRRGGSQKMKIILMCAYEIELSKMRRGSSEAREAEEDLPWNQVFFCPGSQLLSFVIVVIFVTFDVSCEKILRQKPVSAKAEFKKNRDGMGFMIEGDVRIIIIISILP